MPRAPPAAGLGTGFCSRLLRYQVRKGGIWAGEPPDGTCSHLARAASRKAMAHSPFPHLIEAGADKNRARPSGGRMAALAPSPASWGHPQRTLKRPFCRVFDNCQRDFEFWPRFRVCVSERGMLKHSIECLNIPRAPYSPGGGASGASGDNGFPQRGAPRRTELGETDRGATGCADPLAHPMLCPVLKRAGVSGTML